MMFGSKPEIIKALEKTYNRKLKRVSIKDLWRYPGFCIDDRGEVIRLNLKGCGIADVSPLASLTALKELRLDNNRITDVSPLGSLTALTSLDLDNNQIADVLPLASLTVLKQLWLNNNRIADVSPLGSLTALIELHLIGNQITDVSPMGSLTALTILNLSDNQITDVSPLASLTALTRLDLDNNQITNVSPLAPLFLEKKLIVLLPMTNKITRLPPEIIESGMPIKWKFDGRDGIFLEGNPLESPPVEIVKRGHEAVVAYFRQLETPGQKAPVRLCQSKLLIVGNGEVGKTTLMKKLKEPDFKVIPGQEPTTHGINIFPWQLPCCFDGQGEETVNISFWDFGGQDIYHATHQFFLTKRSLYLLVWEARKEEDTRSFDYWLNVVKLLGSGSPVIVVMNKADLRSKPLDEASLKKKFPNIVDFMAVSCLDGRGLQELTEKIGQTLAAMPHLQDQLPASWLDIRDDLKAIEENYIPSGRYFDLCVKRGLGRQDAEFVGDYLHDLGFILFFRDDRLLADTVILNPEWATKAVYALIDTREIIDGKGSFHFRDLERYWDAAIYPRARHPQIVRLMEKFELCFNFVHSDDYFIPELLPGDLPGFGPGVYQHPGTLHVQYRYEFMPEGILSRLIARLYYLIKEERFWKYGVELQFEGAYALVSSETINRRLQVAVTGACKSELLAIIRSDLSHIHATLNMENGVHYNEMVPCTCATCATADNPYLFSYNTLRRFIDKGKTVIDCLESAERVDIYTLIKGIAPVRPTKDLLTAVLDAAVHLQGLAKGMKPDEDVRTGLIVTLLKAQGFMAGDQGRWGRSATGKSLGIPDARIESDQGLEAILEAFCLESLDTNAIDEHCIKIFGYDPHGLGRNFMVVYVESKDFPGLWAKYKKHLNDIPFPHPLLPGKGIEEKPVRFAEIRVALARHERQEQEIGIYHVFINMRPR